MRTSYCPRGIFRAFAAVTLAFVVAEPLLAQVQHTDAAKMPLAFEVATVKPVNPHDITVIDAQVYRGGHLIIHAHRLAMLIAEAFNIPEWEIVGGDQSVVQAWFDVEGKPLEELLDVMPESGYSEKSIQDARVRSMLQSLLIERFQLKFHIEGQPGTVYHLQRGDGPLRLTLVERKSYLRAENASIPPESSSMTGQLLMTSGSPLSIRQTSMLQLVQLLANVRLAPVSDQTKLPGFYDFTSKTVVTYEDFQDEGPMHLLVDAVSEMGLKLVKTHGVVEKFVIDKVKSPTAN